MRLRPSNVLDASLCEYADFQFVDGEGAEHGEKLKASLVALYPELLGPNLLHTPRFQRSLRGWRKMAPTRSRNAILESLCFTISAILDRRGLR